jgi:hypothetical protein
MPNTAKMGEKHPKKKVQQRGRNIPRKKGQHAHAKTLG